MTMIDREKERTRLAAKYAAMSDIELNELAEDQPALTEDAKEILETEFSRRGLKMEPVDPAVIPIRKDLKLVTLREFRDLPQALVAKSVLDSAGVECFLADENTVRMDWLWSNMLGGVKLRVRQEDAREAADLLDQDFSEELHEEQRNE